MIKLKIVNIGWANSIHVERLMRWLAKKGHNISIITNIPKEISGVKVYDLRRKPDIRLRLERYKDFYFNVPWIWLYRINEIIRIRKLVNEISPDIIHSHSLWYPGYLGVYIKGYPFVITVLNGDVLWEKDDISIYTRLRTRWGLKKADMVTGESQVLINACIKHGVDKSKAYVTRGWGVDLTVFKPVADKMLLREKLNLPGNTNIVLSPRTIDSLYNLKTLIQAIPKVVSKIKSVIFVFIGHHINKKYLDELKAETRNLNVQDNVIFVGKVAHNQVAEYHQSSDIFVSVSPKDSGPIALQEAMSCGAAPVISDIPSVRELVQDGYNGFLVDPYDTDQIVESIIKILMNNDLRERFVERNFEIVRGKCDQEYWMARMENLYYRTVVNSKNIKWETRKGKNDI